MRIYPKQLKNLHSLQKEKRKLQLIKNELDKEELFSIESIAGQGSSGNSWVDMLPISNPLVSTLLNTLNKRLFKSSSKEEKRSKKEESSEKPKKNILLVVAKEVLGGYLKWKAIELSYKGIKLVIKNSRQKEE